MIRPGKLEKRRQELSEKIARERTEMGVAYRGLAKPFQLTETGITAFKAVRKNSWLIALAPTAVNLAFSFFGWEKKGKPSLLGQFRRKAGSTSEEVREAEKLGSKGRKPLRRWAGRAWSLFQLYRKFRPYFP